MRTLLVLSFKGIVVCLLFVVSCKQLPQTDDSNSEIKVFKMDSGCNGSGAGKIGFLEDLLTLDMETRRFTRYYLFSTPMGRPRICDTGRFELNSDTLHLIKHELGEKKYFEAFHNPELNDGEYKILHREFMEGKRVFFKYGFGLRINDSIEIIPIPQDTILRISKGIETIQPTDMYGMLPVEGKKHKVAPSENEFVFRSFDGRMFDKTSYLWKRDSLVPLAGAGVRFRCKLVGSK